MPESCAGQCRSRNRTHGADLDAQNTVDGRSRVAPPQ